MTAELTELPPHARRITAVATGGEREVLEAFLDFHRAIAVGKARDLSDADARQRLVPSENTVAGLLKHLAVVERSWFGVLAGRRPEPDGGFELDASDTVDALVAAYERDCDRSRELAAGFDLDHVVTHPQLGEVSLRWIYVHMVEETARHVGHADILRELTDGSTGPFG